VPDVLSLTVLDVLSLREAYLEALGHPSAPLRDIGLLESAVARPQTAASYEGADLVRQAALLGAGIVQNHPWQDGNQRGAYVAVINFLRLNRRRVRLPAGDSLALARELEALSERRRAGATLEEATGGLEAWLRAHTEPVAPAGTEATG
jgi:death-on-curing protein